MKKLVFLSMLLHLIAIALFICSIVLFSNDSTTVGTVCVSCGFAVLIPGIFLSRKLRKENR